MAPFRYEPYRSPYVGSISDLLQRPADIEAQRSQIVAQAQAQAAIESGRAWSGAVQGIAQTVGQVPGQIAGMQQQQQASKLRDLQLQQTQMQVTSQKSLQETQQQISALMNNPAIYNDDGTMNAQGIAQLLQRPANGGEGPMPPVNMKNVFDTVSSFNEDITKTRESQMAWEAQKTNTLANAAAKILKLGAPSAPGEPDTYSEHTVLMLGAMLKSKQITPADATAILTPMTDSPESAQRVLQSMAARSTRPDIKVGKDESLVNPDTQAVDFKNVVAEPNKGDYTINGQRFHADGTLIGTVQPPQASPTPKGMQTEKFQLDGKSVMGTFNPTDGTYHYNGQDVTARAVPIPAASITIRNMQGNVPNLPTWALDDSRPTGPDANKLDDAVRMTPNGLYQAAQNYIANGQFPPTGRGSDPASLAVRTAIVSKVGAIAAASGMDEPALRAFYKANQASLTAEQKMADAVQGFMATADKNTTLLEGTLKKLPDIGSPLFNKPLRAFMSGVAGDPNMAQFATYLQSVQNEYARIISQPNLAGQLTDSARKEAEALISPKSTVPQILASIQALKNEGTNRVVSIGEQIQRIQQRMQTGPGAPPASTATDTGRVRVVGPNGQTGTVPAGTTLPTGWRKQ